MKTRVKLLAFAAIVFSIGGAYAFTSGEGEGEGQKRMEVIRTKNGVTTIYDTIISSSSAYTPEQYLQDLGFGEDENVQIIHVQTSNLESEFSNNFIEINSEEANSGDAKSDQVIIKKIELNHTSDEHFNPADIDIDSLVSLFITNDGDTNVEMTIEKHVVFMNVEEGEYTEGEELEWIPSEGEPDIHFINEEDDRKLEVMVFGEQEDMTMVIVSDCKEASLNKKQTSLELKEENTDNASFEIYPNPGSEIINLTYSFESEAITKINVLDASGKQVLSLERGKENGTQNVSLDFTNLPAGIYFVNLLHGETKMIRKVVVE